VVLKLALGKRSRSTSFAYWRMKRRQDASRRFSASQVIYTNARWLAAELVAIFSCHAGC
jgi:hypothetical protein